jgi:hypothetical protein
MWANGPKEMHEFHDYPFDVHYKKPTPSFPSLLVFRDYLEGILSKLNDIHFIQFQSIEDIYLFCMLAALRAICLPQSDQSVR